MEEERGYCFEQLASDVERGEFVQQEMVRDAVKSLLDVKEDYRKFGVCGESEADALEKNVDMVMGAVLCSECKLVRMKEVIT